MTNIEVLNSTKRRMILPSGLRSVLPVYTVSYSFDKAMHVWLVVGGKVFLKVETL